MRWPGTITAAADAATGVLLFPCDPLRGGAAVAAATLLYAGGVVCNDAADADRDRTLHPGRPIPSGAVTRRAALAFGGTLLAAGIGAAAAAGSASLAAFAGVAVAVLLYDFALKRFGLLGPLALGFCRGGSVLAAALTSPTYEAALEFAPGRALLYPLPWLLQGIAVTAASLLEESPRGRALAPAAAAGILLPSALAFPLLARPGAGSLGFAIAATALFTYVLGRALARSRLETGPDAVGAVVREGVFGFLLLDATVLGLRGEAWPAGGAILLWMAFRVALRARRS